MTPPPATALVCATLLLCVPWPTPLHAQDHPPVRGVILEAGSDRPIAGAVIEVEGESARAISNLAGEFVLPLLSEGSYLLEIRQFGFTTVRVPIDVPRRSPLRVGLAPEPIGLEGLTVTARRLAAAEEVQTSRRNSYPRAVQFIAPERIESHQGPAEFLLQTAGVDVSRCRAERRGCPRICIDERVAHGGLDELNSYPVEVIHSIEIYAGLPTVRAYTKPFMEAVALGREQLRNLRFC